WRETISAGTRLSICGNVAADGPDDADESLLDFLSLLCLFVANSAVSSPHYEKTAISHCLKSAARGGSAFRPPRRRGTLRGKCNRLYRNCGRGATRRSAPHHRARRSQ